MIWWCKGTGFLRNLQVCNELSLIEAQQKVGGYLAILHFIT